jgi:endonuclease-8
VPEGDTVRNVADAVGAALTGAVLTRTDFRVPALATTDLAGWTVAESTCYGKHLLLRLEREGREPHTLHSHLRMEGAWRIRAPGDPLPGPSHRVRVVLTTASAMAVGVDLHELALVPTSEEQRLIGHLGPDLLRPGGASTRRCAGCGRVRSGTFRRRCSTSATWPASATSTATRR